MHKIIGKLGWYASGIGILYLIMWMFIIVSFLKYGLTSKFFKYKC